MPHERRPPDDPREWINRARSNLVRAQAMLPGVYLEDLCFDAQQAAEKAIKAVLIARGAVFPPIHDLAKVMVYLTPEKFNTFSKFNKFNSSLPGTLTHAGWS